MKPKSRRKSNDRPPKLIRFRPVDEAGLQALASPTAVAAEALRTGVLPVRVLARRQSIPRGDDTMLIGDPDDRSLENEYVGEETPGGNNPTPDQSLVDEIGRAYGLQDEDSSGCLRSGAEVLGRRDRHRTELQPPRKPWA
jgi:hypothetical protein